MGTAIDHRQAVIAVVISAAVPALKIEHRKHNQRDDHPCLI